MAYTVPTINSSAQTWAQLGGRGLEAFVNAVLVSNSASQANINRTHQLMHRTQSTLFLQRLTNIVDNYENGKSDKTSAKADILEMNYALKTLNEAVEEIGVLIDAN